MKQAPSVTDRPTTARPRWSRTLVNFGLDTLLLALFAGLAAVSVVIRFVFPPATVADGYTIWGLGYDDWAGIQFGFLASFALAVVVHVMLHWSWVCNVVASRLRRPGSEPDKRKLDDGIMTLYGVGLLIGVFGAIGALVAAAALSVKS